MGITWYNNPIDTGLLDFISVPCCAILHLHREAPISAFAAQSPGLRGDDRGTHSLNLNAHLIFSTIFHRVDSDPEWVNHDLVYVNPFWLVVDLPLWKMMEFVSWDDDIPNWMESLKIPWFQTTNQKCMFDISWHMLKIVKCLCASMDGYPMIPYM
jgi:hypothetical protein